ncbi:unnamed protein product [Rotaria sp. Silwood1]|nr:unnamed protein product [Rotaria sp. Silwood1]
MAHAVLAPDAHVFHVHSLRDPWHHFSTSLIIAMRLTLVDNWNLIGPELEKKGSPLISRWFLTIIVFVGNRIVTNVLKKRKKKNLRNQKKREELSTIQVLNTKVSDTNNKMNTTENTIEQIKEKLKLIHNEIITPKDFIFSIDWLEKLITNSEKSHIEAKSARHLIIHLIQSLSNIINENMKKNESNISIN